MKEKILKLDPNDPDVQEFLNDMPQDENLVKRAKTIFAGGSTLKKRLT